ncbi:SDR family NAD(P)-dependent oxidoreductase [Micromonospora sp. DT31]|uniref:SDR family NAD(P)-dependent oxidoreductase n=1 Tax=Micromonospora sp. DT31 TaxID=3393434 RepID=UPI003CFAE031
MTDKVVLVTGGGFSPDQAGSGLGQSMCVELASEGAKVVVADLSLERAEATATQVREAGGDALAVAADGRHRRVHGHTIPVDGGSPIR